MNWLKNGLVIALLMGVGWGVYVVVHNAGDDIPPSDVDVEKPDMSSISKGIETGPPGTNAATGRSTKSPAPGDEAPPFMPGKSATTATPASGGLLAKSSASPPIDNAVRGNEDIGGRDSRNLPANAAEAWPPNSTGSAAASSGNDRATVTANTAAAAAGRRAEISPNRAPPDDATKAAPSSPAQDRAAFAAAWDAAQKLLDQNQLDAAHGKLSQYYGLPSLTPTEDQKLTELLGQLAGTILYDATTDFPLASRYVLKSGETFDDVARANKVTTQLLAKINGMEGVKDPKSLRPGDAIKVVRGPFDAIVNLRREEVTLVLDGHYAGRFTIQRIGRDFSSPAQGDVLQVREKSDRDGDHWVGLEGRTGIHGDASTRRSPGPAHDSVVIAMKDAAELFDIMTEHSRVEIRR